MALVKSHFADPSTLSWFLGPWRMVGSGPETISQFLACLYVLPSGLLLHTPKPTSEGRCDLSTGLASKKSSSCHPLIPSCSSS